MRKYMAALFSGALLLAVAAAASADVVEKRTTETTTYKGTVTEVDPSSSTIILRSETPGEPTRYTFTKRTTFVDAAGNTITTEQLRGNPVTVFSTQEGDRLVVNKVIVERPASRVIERKETEERHEIR
jgi:hypothetical protein